MPNFEQAHERIAQVDGWLSADQAERLFNLARTCHAGERIVEIGSFRGRSTIMLALGAPEGVEIVAIDPHAGNDRGPQEIEGYEDAAQGDHEIFLANLRAAGVGDRVRHVRAFSDAAHDDVEGEITLLYIDGAHRYRPALADIRDWGVRVRPGGHLAIHDSFSSVGVTLAIGRELAFGSRWRYLGRARSLAVYRADLDGTTRARVSNAARQAAQLPWFARNLVFKVLLTVRLGGVLRRITGRSVEWPY